MITQIVKFTVQPEHSEAFQAALMVNQQGARAETGLLEMRLFAEKQQPHVFYAYERWKDQAAIAHHLTQDHTRALLNLAKTTLQSPVEVMNLNDTTPAPLHEANTKHRQPEDDVFSIFFIFKFKPGYRERLLQQFEKHITHTRQEPGNLLFDLYTVDGADDTLVVYEHWRQESDVWEIHFKQPYAEATGALLAEAVEGDLLPFMRFVTELA